MTTYIVEWFENSAYFLSEQAAKEFQATLPAGSSRYAI